jgi:hypothetical protein
MDIRKWVRPILPVLAFTAASAQAAVVVSFVEPERYTDAGDRTWDREDTVRKLDEYFHRLGDRYLASGQTLRLEVLDVDLAGWAEFGGRGAHRFRTVTGRSDFPAIRVRYTLESPGGRGETREETIEDTSYLTRNLNKRAAASEPLYYEKRMLDDWFRERFASAARR